MRSKRASRSLGLTLCLVATSGCADFDDAIYKSLDPDKASTKDGGGGSGGDGGGGAGNANAGEGGMSMLDGGDSGGTNNNGNNSPNGNNGEEDAAVDDTPRLVDLCEDPEAFRLTTSLLTDLNEVSFMASTLGFKNDIETTKCFAYQLPGSEAAMSIEMEAAERWHFHITPKNKVSEGQAVQNPVLYMRNDCSDNRGCNEGSFLDLCGDAQEEHFTFEAPTKGVWHFILDDRNNVQGDYLVRAVKSVCGNDIKEHNEACDTPGNNNCSLDCRVIVSLDNAAPDEPNDDFSASVILGRVEEMGSQSVKGSIGGVCDVDYYAFSVPENGKVEAKIRKATGDKCLGLDASVSTTTLELLAPDARTVLGEGTLRMDGPDMVQCPFIDVSDTFANGLDAGLYYLRVRGEETKNTFAYQLSVVVSND